ncbi:uncharacterized protein KY384_009248 [Bacidia gigantensis]|uniref:uncharacterized protein n=1 Tax=Bacidia gigantensis TaxID=2732470 RepID=UPI001D03D52D|nr:uncharacterized protein KY384_009248 [Bacidia gigantensis]KAG8525604.1 hypothetical protein KY384_009248 [Bacidia gigantensis]
MDPLSVAASIVGILAAAAKTSSVLTDSIRNTRGAPKLAHNVLEDVNSLRAVLSSLQEYILGTAKLPQAQASLILVEQVVVTLGDCVKLFSELEDLLGSSNEDKTFRALERLKWAFNDSKIAELQSRLEKNKTSLFGISKSMTDTETAVNRLCGLVEQILSSNLDMSRRLRTLDERGASHGSTALLDHCDEASLTFDEIATPALAKQPQTVERSQFGFAFEEDLLESRVYQKPSFNDSRYSFVSSAARTTATSVLSAYSLSEISNVAILAVPIYAYEIHNSGRYAWESSTTSGTLSSQSQLRVPAASQNLERSSPVQKIWRGLFVSHNPRRKTNQLQSPDKSEYVIIW